MRITPIRPEDAERLVVETVNHEVPAGEVRRTFGRGWPSRRTFGKISVR